MKTGSCCSSQTLETLVAGVSYQLFVFLISRLLLMIQIIDVHESTIIVITKFLSQMIKQECEKPVTQPGFEPKTNS